MVPPYIYLENLTFCWIQMYLDGCSFAPKMLLSQAVHYKVQSALFMGRSVGELLWWQVYYQIPVVSIYCCETPQGP